MKVDINRAALHITHMPDMWAPKSVQVRVQVQVDDASYQFSEIYDHEPTEADLNQFVEVATRKVLQTTKWDFK